MKKNNSVTSWHCKLDLAGILSDSSVVKYPIRIFVLLLTCALLSAPAFAGYKEWEKPETCVFGMPVMGHAVKLKQTGLVTELLKAVYEPKEIELWHENLPYSRALAGLADGTVDCSLDVDTKQPGVLRGTATIATYDLAVAYLRTQKYTDLNDLKGQRVAFMHGFDLPSMLPVKILPQQAYDLSSAFHMLDRGHAKFILGDNILLEDALYESKLTATDFIITYIKTYNVHPIFPKSDRGKMFRDIFDQRMREMIANGEYQEILRNNGMGPTGIAKALKANGR